MTAKPRNGLVRRWFWRWVWLHPPLLVIGAVFLLWKVNDARVFMESGFDSQESLTAFVNALRERDKERLTELIAIDVVGQVPGRPAAFVQDPIDDVWTSSWTGGVRVNGNDADRRELLIDGWLAYRDQFGDDLRMELVAWNYAPWQGRNRVTLKTLFWADGSDLARGHLRLDEGRGEVILRRRGGQYRIESLRFTSPVSVQAQPDKPAMIDVAAERGMRWVTLPAAGTSARMQSSISFADGAIGGGDFDKDGDTDVLLLGNTVNLYENLGGGFFRERPFEVDPPDRVDGNGVGVIDYNNDGWLDLAISHDNSGRPSQLYKGIGPFEWANTTAESGLHIPAESFNVATIWGDYNRDGFADCYTLNFGDPSADMPESLFNARNGHANMLFKNQGDGTFRDVTAEAGVGDVGFTLAGQFADVDDDGHLDIYSVNDYGPNRLYRNLGNGRFEDITWRSDAVDFGAGMGVSWGDVDGDLDGDLFVSNISIRNMWFYDNRKLGWYGWRVFLHKESRDPALRGRKEALNILGARTDTVGRWFMDGNSLLLNDGQGNFSNEAVERGAWFGGWGWGNRMWDYDNDGDQDLVNTNGFLTTSNPEDVYPKFTTMALLAPRRFREAEFFSDEYMDGRSWQGHERLRVFRNKGGGDFEEMSLGLGLLNRVDSRGVVTIDTDNDGDLDLLVSNTTWDMKDPRPLNLFENQIGNKQSWVQFDLVGTFSDRVAVGAKVIVETDSASHLGFVDTGGSYLCSVVGPVHLGLGKATQINKVTIRWPRGAEQELTGVPLNARVRVTEGRGWELLGAVAAHAEP